MCSIHVAAYQSDPRGFNVKLSLLLIIMKNEAPIGNFLNILTKPAYASDEAVVGTFSAFECVIVKRLIRCGKSKPNKTSRDLS